MEQQPLKRVIAIDRLRGLCMIAVFFQFFLGAMGSTFESWAKLIEHGDDGFQVLPGIAFADLFAPMFIFIVGMTLKLTFDSREKRLGTGKAYFDLAVRFLSLMGLGVIINAIQDGWFELAYGTSFGEIDINMQIFMISSIVFAVIFIIFIIASFVNNKAFSDIATKILRYFLALMGITVLFFVWVSAADRIVPYYGGCYDWQPTPSIFGGYIWDTLENIGFAGLIALPFVKLDKWVKLTWVAFVFFMYTVYVQAGGFYFVESMIEGAPFSGVCWAGILLLGSIFMDLKDEPKKYWSFAIGAIVIAAVLVAGFGIIGVKRGCTPVYALLTSGVCAVIFGILNKLENWTPKFRLLTWWGGSCILTYVLISMLAYVVGFIFEVAELTLPIPVGIIIAFAIFALFSLMNFLLYKKGKHIKL